MQFITWRPAACESDCCGLPRLASCCRQDLGAGLAEEPLHPGALQGQGPVLGARLAGVQLARQVAGGEVHQGRCRPCLV